MLTIGLSTIITGNLTLNMLIIIPVFLALSVAGYFINDILSKKKYKKLDNNIEEDKN